MSGQREQYLRSCQNIFMQCYRLADTDNTERETVEFIIRKLESLERSLQRASGDLLDNESAQSLLRDIQSFFKHMRYTTDVTQVASGYQTQRVHLEGDRGAPRYQITEDQLKFLHDCGFTSVQMAGILKVSESTVRRRLRSLNMQLSHGYSEMSDDELDTTIQALVRSNQEIGPNAVKARLIGQGIKVQRWRVRESMVRVDPTGEAQRAVSRRLQRRTYSVAGPNSLWHMDGNHKLIRWKIVIHGCVDGYSRLYVFWGADNNNRASTVMRQFADATTMYGIPSRIRCDHGGENNEVCMFMELVRGANRGSAIRGTSVHNQRCERSWVDMWNGVSNLYYELIYFLEDNGIIDLDRDHHIWALHYVFLPRINIDLQVFVAQWNNHPLHTARHLTPLQLYVRDMLALSNSNLTAVREVFQELEHDAPVEDIYMPNDFEWHDSVNVPNIDCPLSEDRFASLQAMVNRLDDSTDNLGITLFQETVQFISQEQ